MDRIADLESEVDTLRKRVEVTRHVAEDMSVFVSADPELVTLVVDDVLAHWTLEAPDRTVADVWRDYANRVEWEDAAQGTMRPEMCTERPSDRPFDQELYFAVLDGPLRCPPSQRRAARALKPAKRFLRAVPDAERVTTGHRRASPRR